MKARKPASADASPVEKRQDVTQSELEAAREVVAAAIAEVEQHKAMLKAHEQSAFGPNDTLSIPFPTTSDEVAKAAALVAEADAAVLASEGKLFKDYTLKGEHAKFNRREFPDNSQFSKRAAVADPYYFLPDMASQYPGHFPFGGDSSYTVYRNVKDAPFNAKGDGVTDDTAAINAAIAYGNRCADNCGSSSVKGALIYFPAGMYQLVLESRVGGMCR